MGHQLSNQTKTQHAGTLSLLFTTGFWGVLMGLSNRDEVSLTSFMTKEISEWEC
jgi:hypothetical protein